MFRVIQKNGRYCIETDEVIEALIEPGGKVTQFIYCGEVSAAELHAQLDIHLEPAKKAVEDAGWMLPSWMRRNG